VVTVPRSNRLKLSLAGTAAVALASLPFGITPANAAKVPQGTASSIGVVVETSNAQQFNLGNRGVQSVAIYDGRVGTAGSGRKFPVPVFLLRLLQFLGIQTTAVTAPTTPWTF
jgi:hypothetical protein